ncbi:hypothetical protein TNCV_4824301 [Trichonephila clavipes]|nr:hypothetical protein TNCV_4824301 [Trichonephila clavipes]
MKDKRYVRDDPQPHVSSLKAWLPGAIFQQNNTRPHMTSATFSNIPGLLNHQICHLHSISKNHLGRQFRLPPSVDDLEAHLRQMGKDGAGHRTELECINARLYHIMHSC